MLPYFVLVSLRCILVMGRFKLLPVIGCSWFLPSLIFTPRFDCSATQLRGVSLPDFNLSSGGCPLEWGYTLGEGVFPPETYIDLAFLVGPFLCCVLLWVEFSHGLQPSASVLSMLLMDMWVPTCDNMQVLPAQLCSFVCLVYGRESILGRHYLLVLSVCRPDCILPVIVQISSNLVVLLLYSGSSTDKRSIL